MRIILQSALSVSQSGGGRLGCWGGWRLLVHEFSEFRKEEHQLRTAHLRGRDRGGYNRRRFKAQNQIAVDVTRPQDAWIVDADGHF